MCIVAFAINQHERYPFIFISNRDEIYQRSALAIHFWPEHPELLAGQDMKEKGTWLGLTCNGKIATLLNHPFTGVDVPDNVQTRGKIVYDYLVGSESKESYLQILQKKRKDYAPYHLVFGDIQNLSIYSNANNRYQNVPDGRVYAISNTDDDLSSFRVEKAKRTLAAYINSHTVLEIDDLITLFQDKESNPKMTNFPQSLSLTEARAHSAIFIEGKVFGTVGTTAILIDKNGLLTEKEVTYQVDGKMRETSKSFQLSKH